jgi:hypothetical protein
MTQTATVVLTKNLTATLPAGSAAYASTLITLTDSSGAQFTAEVDGQESPAWTAEFPGLAQSAGGSGSAVAQDQDASGKAIGSLVSLGTYTDLPGTGAATFPQTTGGSITLTSP